MYEGRDLRKEIDDLGIVTMEDFGLGSRESAFAALDAIRKHNKQFPEDKLIELNQAAIREATASMSGTRNNEGGD